jgi:hypothetical protein
MPGQWLTMHQGSIYLMAVVQALRGLRSSACMDMIFALGLGVSCGLTTA